MMVMKSRYTFEKTSKNSYLEALLIMRQEMIFICALSSLFAAVDANGF